jgi:hypothetical protein
MESWDGWSSYDKYKITSDNSVIIESTMSLQDKYFLDTTCIQSGCYKAILELSTKHASKKGTYISIPQCNDLFLTSLHKEEFFCISNDVTISSKSVSCLSSCFNSAHVTISLLLFEGGGEGWSSNYYLIDSIKEDSHGKVTTSSVSAGTLEWDYSKNEDICLPISNTNGNRKCYLLQLYAEETLYEPGIYFPNSIRIITGGEVVDDDPVTISNDDNMIPNKDEVQNLCPYSLEYKDNAIVSIICVDDELVKSTISFYYDKNGVDISRELNLEWNNRLNRYVSDKLTHYGTCQTVTNDKTPTVFPTPIPTSIPSDIPTSIPSDIPTSIPSDIPKSTPSYFPTSSPTTVAPTSIPSSMPSIPSSFPSQQPSVNNSIFPTSSPSNLPSNLPSINPTSGPTIESILFIKNNYSCFSSCTNYDKLYDSTHLNGDLCFFLLADIYRGCNSYSISTGTCNRPNCTSKCSIDDWCHFAVEAVFICERKVTWISLNNVLNEFQSSCINNSLIVSNVDEDITSTNNNNNENNSSNLFSSSAIQGIIAFIILLFFLFILYSLIKEISKSSQNSIKNEDYEIIQFNKQIDTDDII